jgi:hypothetical protein
MCSDFTANTDPADIWEGNFPNKPFVASLEKILNGYALWEGLVSSYLKFISTEFF